MSLPINTAMHWTDTVPANSFIRRDLTRGYMRSIKLFFLGVAAVVVVAACGGGGGLAPPVRAFDPATVAGLGQGVDPHLALGAGGNALVAYLDRESGSVRSRRFDASTRRFGPEHVVAATNPAANRLGDLTLKFSADGATAVAVWTLHQIFTGIEDVWVAIYRDGVWRVGEPLTGMSAGEARAMHPDVAFDAAGNAIVVWTQPNAGDRKTVSRRLAAGQNDWGPPTVVATLKDAQGTRTHQRLQLAPLPGGDFILVASERLSPPGGGQDRAYLALYRHHAADATWRYGNAQESGLTFELPDAPKDGDAEEFDLAMNAAGRLVLVWAQAHRPSTQIPPLPARRSIRLAHFDLESGRWHTASDSVDHVSAGTAPSGSSGWRSGLPRAALDQAGNGLIVWVQEDPVNADVFSVHTRRFNGAEGALGAPAQALAGTSGVDGSLALSMRATGQALMVWPQVATSSEAEGLYYAAYDPQALVFSAPALVAPANTGGVEGEEGAALVLAPSGMAIAVWQAPSNGADELLFNVDR